MQKNRRHSLWYERILLSFRIHLLLGLIVAVGLPALWHWGWTFWSAQPDVRVTTLVATAVAYLISISTVHRLSVFPGTRAFAYVIPSITLSYILIVCLLLFLALPFARSQMVASYVISMIYGCAGYLLANRYRTQKLAVVPMGRVNEFCQTGPIDWRWLSQPDLQDMRVDGVVADLATELDEDWQRFLADCTIHRIPVYDAREVHENMTGRVGLDHLYQNRYGSLLPREDYEIIKRCIDIVGVLLVMPAVLPIMAVTAIMIKRDDPGPAIFVQKRMGFQCRTFSVYKFRSMYVNQEGLGFTAEGEDPRITKVGRILRKYRIDELPQLFNVLKGDMSLIGPRPESSSLAEWYEKDVPFFHYRHVVRPGISGWAQVEQGYAAEIEGMTRKLEYDFYYIRHFSFWMDMLIVIRTIKTIFTGHGAR
ncbi:exopolysaccharide biosynthesis polyprenyl glycosylphosphotransferase [Kushneria phosphatilytica]|uniref:Exopolysaccharide biosynthesis polyprenyl glycosylphosphotransferase n=1 Tax=Kushneria phosphatilytica TaxID=657387 RepID=A0A1S1P0P2_9GAMM|nr:exopolysaccharide biosynthesis polyprenyl glycosylphosphotransferase [Kushneria phosphatilytica]OHV12055.1 glycosyl transferase [Kushneria phosphatilytica]QEL11246.1 exopolysaccharide biosynthesis polyprenyl glycosylphosphotransferase [Kushneria phosphatilytica]